MTEKMAKHLLISTAGHVDHGKTALIGALTGIDTDRLEEEHERGISIVLGFASYEPSGDLDAQIGIVDVPGHERFIKTMVAGATGVDVALFVIACDEGVKPQTLEHLEILTLLGVEHGVIALTKMDLVDDPEWAELVAEDIRDLVAPTFLAGASIVPVSVETGQGLDELRNELEKLLSEIPERETGSGFRLPIDRSFTVKGIGTVVTGSVWSGTALVGDSLQLQPAALDTRVREIEQHGRSVQVTSPGTRTALALHGVSVEEASPGSWLITPGSLSPTRTVDLHIRHLASSPAPLKHNQRIRVHHGTLETFGRLRILEVKELAAGVEGFAQLRLEEPLVASIGDRILLRRYSPMRTIAGATILDTGPPRHRRSDPAVVERLELGLRGEPLDIISSMVHDTGLTGVALAEAARRSTLTDREIMEHVESRGWIVVNKLLVSRSHIESAVQELTALLDAAHMEYPLRRGLSSEAIASSLGIPAGSVVLEAVLQRAEAEGLIGRDPPFWRRSDFEIRFEGVLAQAASALLHNAEERDLLPWKREEAEAAARAALEAVGLKKSATGELLEALLHQGRFVRYPGGFILSSKGHGKLLKLIQAHFEGSDELSVSEFRDLSGGLTRKFSIPILEYLDSEGFTVRKGDVRVPGPALDRLEDAS